MSLGERPLSGNNHPPAPGQPAPRAKAVALKYDAATDSAPRITATGAGKNAEQILEIAFSHGVRVREDPDLVEFLEALEPNSAIPEEAFRAIAEILFYVYRANRKLDQLFGVPESPTQTSGK